MDLTTAEQVCSYCNKSLRETTPNGGTCYRVAIFLENGDTTLQICEGCVAKAFIAAMIEHGTCTDCMIDFFDRVNIGHKG